MEAAIEKCCDFTSLDDNWAQILHITDTYAVGQPKHCLKLVTKKIFQPNPNISMKAITLLDSCVKNVGNSFAREMSSKDFVNTFKQKYPKLQAKPRLKLLQLTKQWADDYKSNPEFSLLASLYSWIQNEHPSHINELESFRNIDHRLKSRAVDRNLKTKEEEDIATAIALSLTEVTSSAIPQPQASASAYPNLELNVATVNRKERKGLGRVRALFDFEAAEDNELTFKAGDMITLLDESDPNWWKGSVREKEGLFPAQFVSRELDEAATPNNASTPKPESRTSQLPVKIDPQLIDNCLEMLGDADTTGVTRPDPVDLPTVEQQCRAMEPLIEAELEGVYTKISETDALKQRLSEALAQYHELVTVRSTVGQPQPFQVFQPQMTQAIGNPMPNPPTPVAYNQPGGVSLNAQPQPMMYPPPPPQPPATAVYPSNLVPQPILPFGAPPAFDGSSMIMYGQPPPVYGYPIGANAWQLQQPPPQPYQAPMYYDGAPSANAGDVPSAANSNPQPHAM